MAAIKNYEMCFLVVFWSLTRALEKWQKVMENLTGFCSMFTDFGGKFQCKKTTTFLKLGMNSSDTHWSHMYQR